MFGAIGRACRHVADTWRATGDARDLRQAYGKQWGEFGGMDTFLHAKLVELRLTISKEVAAGDMIESARDRWLSAQASSIYRAFGQQAGTSFYRSVKAMSPRELLTEECFRDWIRRPVKS